MKLMINCGGRLGPFAAKPFHQFSTMRILCVAFILLSCLASVAAQAPADSKKRRPDQEQSAELLRLRGDLDRLIIEARTLQDQNSRPDAVIAVADTYWELDQNKARDLFLTALDLARRSDVCKQGPRFDGPAGSCLRLKARSRIDEEIGGSHPGC